MDACQNCFAPGVAVEVVVTPVGQVESWCRVCVATEAPALIAN